MLLILIAITQNANTQSPTGKIQGKITDENNTALPGASVFISALSIGTVSDLNGIFQLSDITPGEFSISATMVGYVAQSKIINVKSGEDTYIEIKLLLDINVLDAVTIKSTRDYGNVKHMEEIEGTLIYSGKRNDVVILDKTNANTAENIPRQVFSKVPGVYEWDFDGSGNQTSIAVRGLNPHRSWEFNVRENGYNVNSDVFGYPESHYNPATEALSRVELVRGGACLQYGPQYGGMLNYVIKEGPTDKKVDYETRVTYGANNMVNTYNALGGTIGKLNYYGYINFRTSDGFRQNSGYSFYTAYAGLHYAFSEKLKMGFEYSKMYYVAQQAGGLTDDMFAEDPYQSTRARNYFQPNHNIPALTIDYTISPQTKMSLKSNLIIGQRNSVMFIASPLIADSINPVTLEYAPRQVDRDYYSSITNELRILHSYKIGERTHTFSAGLRYSDSRTHRKQRGIGTTATDFDLSLTSPYGLDLNFVTNNYAFCAENLFHVTNKLSVTPGFRYEIIQTNMSGDIDFGINNIDYNKDRRVPLGGLGIQYNINKETNIYGNLSQAYRPILYSDITPTASFDIIDPDMVDSKGFNSDFGIRGKLKEYLIFDIGVYYLKYGDRIGALGLIDEEGNSYVYKTNVGTSIAQGVESLIEFHPTALGKGEKHFGDLSIFISAAYDHARYVDAITSANGQEVNLEGNILENAPEWLVRDGITYNYKFISTTIQTSYVSEIYSDALNTAEATANGVLGIVPSYFIVDWNATFRFKAYNIKAGINNLNNEKYYTRRINNYPGPGILPADGRTFFVSLGKEF